MPTPLPLRLRALRGGRIPARVCTRPDVRPGALAILFIHGGGFMEMPHGFLMFSRLTARAYESMDEMAREIGKAFAGEKKDLAQSPQRDAKVGADVAALADLARNLKTPATRSEGASP